MGRVGWGFDHLWPSMLAPITPILASFSHAVWEAAAEMGSDESIPVKRRRQIMEAAAWVREALYCFAGHAGRLVQVTLPRKRKRSHKESHGPNEDVKSCLEQEKWNRSHEFATLYSSNPAKAAAYVASFFKRQKTFKISLKEETTGEYLPAEKAAALVANDLWIRGNAHHDSSEDDGSSRQLHQFGGKYDAIALLVAVMLHVQIRDYQGLMSYVLFADMKQAFDVANKDLMLYMCYLAGITATEWLLLHDFLQSG